MALAICLRLFGRHVAQNIYQDFKRHYIAALPQENFTQPIDISTFLPMAAAEIGYAAERFYCDLETRIYGFFELCDPNYSNPEEVSWDGRAVSLRIGDEHLAKDLANHIGEGQTTPQPDGYWLFAATFQVPEALQQYLGATLAPAAE